jgi:hypothetical protein
MRRECIPGEVRVCREKEEEDREERKKKGRRDLIEEGRERKSSFCLSASAVKKL